MGSQFGINTMTFYVIFPILFIVAVAIIWFIVKIKVARWKRVVIGVGGLFAFIGFSVFVFGLYYQVNKPFAGSFKYYAYSALSPDKRDPFSSHSNNQRLLMIRSVGYNNGEVKLLRHPNSDYPTLVYLFVPGKFIIADLRNDTLSVPKQSRDSFPRVEKTSFWWALTRNMYSSN